MIDGETVMETINGGENDDNDEDDFDVDNDD